MKTRRRLPLTAFPKTERLLRQQLKTAPLAAATFQRPLKPCQLADCQATCCYDGVYLSDEEAAVVAKLARQKARFFQSLRLELPSEVVVEGDWKGIISGPKTAVRERPLSKLVKDYPPHFTDTACIFLLADGRCSLQVLSQAEGRHPWFYKPMVCWLHPIALADDATLVLYDDATDPQKLPDYDGFASQTFCGRTACDGQPAYEVLRAELTFLGEIVGRDFLAEIETAEWPD